MSDTDRPTGPRPTDPRPSGTRPTAVLPGDERGSIERAVAAIRAGEPVAFPTETVYGLGANALDPLAVARIFEAKERPWFDPLIVHLADPADVARYAEPVDAADPRVERLARRFWPGPLTVVLRKRPLIPGIVTAGLPTVALRVPAHRVALDLIRAAGVPIAAPSANRFGRLSPTRAEHVVAQLAGRIGIVLDGGPCPVGVESTVVLLAEGRAVLLRPGGLPAEAIEAEIGPLEAAPDRPEGELAALSPGRQAIHYAPATPLELRAPDAPVRPAPGERIGLLAIDEGGRLAAESAGGPFAAVEVLSRDGDPVEVAAALFEALHRLDEAGVDRIVAQPLAEEGLGRAVMDRLRRAAAAARTR